MSKTNAFDCNIRKKLGSSEILCDDLIVEREKS